ncbi:MAG: TIGR04013 family B12-binding domain/radical SAM domain-containing protein [Candidatus Thorarchaeota archaeon]
MQQLSTHSLIFRAHSSSRYSVAALVPTFLAHSVMSTQTDRVYGEVKEIREKIGKSITMIGGGPHASARPQELLENGFDFVVVGEGEKTFPELLWYLINDRDPHDIQGVVGENSVDCPRPRDLTPVDLNEYPPFALGLNILGPVEITRGCPYSCKFCCTPFLTGGRVRHRSTSSVVKWLKRAVEKSGFDRTWFLSPNALSYGGSGRTLEYDKVEVLLKAVSTIEGLDEVYFGSFPSEVRPEFVNKPVLEMMKQYVANEALQIGLQSSSNRVLKMINRHHTMEEGMSAIRTALDCGFVPHVDMIFGLPGETIDEMHESVELCYTLAEMGAKTHGHVFMPLPGSAYEKMPPGRLDQESRRRLGELSRKKLLTGSWSAQESLAKDLASQG